MNYHSDEWIMAGVQRHYDEVLTRYRPEQIVAVCYTGSANYNADCEDSDVDTWALVIEDDYNSTDYKVEMYWFDNEVIWLTDIRAFIYGLSYSDFWYMQGLYTKYKVINPTYEHIIARLYEHKEAYAYNNVNNFAILAKDNIDMNVRYFNPELLHPRHDKVLYYVMLMYIGVLTYQNNMRFESIFYNEKYGSLLKHIKNGGISYDEGKRIYNNIAMEVKKFFPNKNEYSSYDAHLSEFSQEQIDKILEVYNEHSNKN